MSSILYWIFEYLATFVEAFICCKFCGIFLKDKKDKQWTIVLFSLFISLLMIVVNSIRLFSYITAILSIFVMCSLQYIVYKKQIGLLTGLSLIYMVILSVADFVIAQVVAIAFNTNADYLLNEQSIQRVICIVLSKTVLALFVYLIYKINKNKIELLKKYLVIICLIAFMLLTFNYFVIGMNSVFNNKELRVFSIFFLWPLLSL